jgi:hypothetical protein
MNWTGQITSSDQGLIIDDETGRNIAVAYDPKHTSLIASTPDLLKALEIIAAGNTDPDRMVDIARAAIDKTTGEQA